MARRDYEYRYVVVLPTNADEVNRSLRQWSEAGWTLHSTVAVPHVQTGPSSSDTLAGYVGMFWQRPVAATDN